VIAYSAVCGRNGEHKEGYGKGTPLTFNPLLESLIGGNGAVLQSLAMDRSWTH
jgi:hypothetical protein